MKGARDRRADGTYRTHGTYRSPSYESYKSHRSYPFTVNASTPVARAEIFTLPALPAHTPLPPLHNRPIVFPWRILK
jgi:hypothetical protein